MLLGGERAGFSLDQVLGSTRLFSSLGIIDPPKET